VAPAAAKGLMVMRLQQMAAQQREDEDEILQTRVVSNQAVFQSSSRRNSGQTPSRRR